ncbi:MAG: 2,3-bisphosphoglycerate-independent phosphoglycerate mutase [Planctomycetales bacterium]|nr:2,3-bisphosphoglycerate-independent phosphoglycerate mutase [Planctomycetales bacterium]NIM09180.1 2,3-bisphosphoglycerate-independent phosphoglycerate mutase [Planctomycetales bacterium]NIN08656.1 2,3-bisphosphoglycerate-independent phosphoglycerate mutase [Planctomycetales bacterium]NIN77775.1 2,3-bisphosphoglycerate-independent phosphoglycerate mutase [Planctomycetales bacterium]NIO34952.1 2,3-bisphosphoglycerate-independent phosphoglycerate mutase [Planctomycetales bacterium]
MDMHDLTRELQQPNDTKIVMLVADGLGGLPPQPGGLTELETARTPHLDELARLGVCGGSIPVKPGVSPGSGPGHLALFGYDPLRYVIGRGALEATGIGFELQENDVAVRCNFCTLDADGKITDRRAGRIPTEQSGPLAVKLREISIPGVEVFVEPVKEHRFVVIFRGDALGGDVEDTDPQVTGVLPLEPVAANPASQRTAEAAAEFVKQACELLADQPQANGLTMRGFAPKPALPGYREVYGLRAAAVAVYPMYKGLARLVGMDVLGDAKTLDQQVQVIRDHWQQYDFFFLHFKYTDSTGEDGDFDAKVKQTEQFDTAIPQIMALKPDVTIVTGDHSTPAMWRAHSWHPVPTLLVADNCRTDPCQRFGESECLSGGLGQFEAKFLMVLALANAGRLGKYGA